MFDWIESPQRLSVSLQFEDFRAAFGFMTRIALTAESLNHHPEWTNVYNRVDIHLTTHEAGSQVTQKDREFANEIDRIARICGAKPHKLPE